MEEPFERLQAARRKAGFDTASEAARYFGWNENTYRSHENGERGLTLNTAIKYARAYRVTYEHLLTGSEVPTLRPVVSIKGNILAGGKVEIIGNKSDTVDVILPFELSGNPYCYVIATNAMLPRYEEGDLLVMWGDDNWLETSKHAEGVAWTEDGIPHFGVATEHSNLVTIEVIGARALRNLNVKKFEVARFVLRDTMYAYRITRTRDEE